jgi:hypothetical protein
MIGGFHYFGGTYCPHPQGRKHYQTTWYHNSETTKLILTAMKTLK